MIFDTISMPEPQGQPFHHIPLDRVSVLIDSIYAFAMTLLVITINIPSKDLTVKAVSPVQGILIHVLPDLLHYFIAFILLAILWYFEHQRFRALVYLDRPLLCMNIASLVFVCLIPFSTNIAGDYPLDHLGAILFESNILVIGLIAFVQWIYLRNHHEQFIPDLSSSHIDREIRWSLVFPALAIGGIALAAIGVPWTPTIFFFAPLIMAVMYWRDPVKEAIVPEREA